MNHLYIDIETTSGANLSSAGAYRYAEDDHFRVLLFGYAVDNDPMSTCGSALCRTWNGRTTLWRNASMTEA